MNIERKLISNSYLNDGISIYPMNAIQLEYKINFLLDKRIDKITLECCPLCSGIDIYLIAEKDRYGIPLDTLLCKKCGLIFSKNQFSSLSTKIFYKDYYRGIYEGKFEDNLDDYKFDKRVVSNFILPKFLSKAKTVLEIGCGGGWNLFKYKFSVTNVTGYDYDINHIEYGKKHLELDLRFGGIDEAINDGIKADFIILSHVVEHLFDPLLFFKKLKHILTLNGIIHISVPPLEYMLFNGKTIGYNLLGTIQIAHNFLFSRFTLNSLANNVGYNLLWSLPGDILIQNTNKKLSNLNISTKIIKGVQVYKFLKFCERTFPIRQKRFLNKFFPKNRVLYDKILYFKEHIKRYNLYKNGVE